MTHKPHSEQLKVTENVYELLVQEKRRRRELEEQLEALRAAVQKELDYMDGFPDVEDGSPLALVIESLRLALSNPASEPDDRTMEEILRDAGAHYQDSREGP